ncbi:MAG: protein kinase [Tatlockia sp.]|nr:protein kinase [Tatlockia sp.]
MVDFSKYYGITTQITLTGKEAEEIIALNLIKEDTFTAYKSYPKFLSYQDGIRFKHNQWFIIDSNPIGEGGFGAVSQSKIKVQIEKDKVILTPANVIVKIVKLVGKTAPERQIEEKAIQKEASNQLKHRIKLEGFRVEGDFAYIIMEDCGPSLDKLLPGNFTFDERLEIAYGIFIDMSLLTKNNTVHRDLKPGNICVKKTASTFEVRFIDFGIAKSNKTEIKNNSGTRYYMAPDENASLQSDIYALAAILAELFLCPDLFKEKRNSPLRDLRKKSYNFDNLFEGLTIPADVDKQLLQDFKDLFKDIQSADSKLRPDINLISKFFLAINQRRLYTKALSREIQYYNYLTSILKGTKPTLFSTIEAGLNSFKAGINKPRSHYLESKLLVENNKTISEYQNPYSFQPLEPIRTSLEAWEGQLKDILPKEKYFKGSNSSGIIEFFKILKSQKSVIQKLDEVKLLGERKIEDNLSNWYSKSSFFGDGRKGKVDEFYQKCAALNLSNPNQSLYDLTMWIENSKAGFIHEDLGCCF